MLRYKDKNGVESPLVKYENLYVEEVLDYGDKTLGFSIPKNLAGKIELEDFIRTKTDEFVIKQMNTNDNGEYDIVAKINIDELEGASFQNFETVEQTALDAANLALAGTGWTCECTVKKKRTVRMTNSSVWDILKKIADTFILEMVIDSLNKKIIFKEKIGEDKGVYFTDELNLVSLTIQSNSSDFYTRILPLGKDGLTIESVNGGSKLLENHTYSSKNKTFIWKDERYTVPESLKEDATAKLEELATPYTSYSCKIVDLANAKKIKAYEYKIGDVITIINKETHTRIKQRIVKLKSYPENPGENTCEISNLKLTFSAYIQKYNSTCNTVDNITNDNGTVDGDAIDNIDASKVLNLDEIISKNARFVTLITQLANVTGQLNANTAKIGTLENTKLSSAEADIKYATIEKFDGVEGKFEDFYAKDFESAVSKIEDLTVRVEKVNTIMFGSASGGSLTTEFSNSIVSLIGDAQIKSAMIKDVSADKITSGKIYTNLVEILSGNGNLDILDNTIQIKDNNKVVRVQIGKDTSNDYNMYVWDKSGNLMFDAIGLTDKGIQREIIRNDMVSQDANISAKKLDINSLFDVINNDGSHTLKSSKIYVDSDNQTLDVAFKQVTTNVESVLSDIGTIKKSINTVIDTISTQGTQITAIQGQISSKVWQQDITTAVADLQIGGRNLFQGTKKFVFQNVIALDGVGSGIATEKYKGLTVRVKTTPWNFYRPTLTLEAGRYVFSSYVKGTSKYKGDIRVTNVTENTTLNANAFDINSEWERQSLTFELAKKANVKFSLESTGSGEIYECGWKLEEGNKATDWTPAPEDIDSSISTVEGKVTTVSNQYTSLNQSLTSLTATVNSNTTKINSKADGSTVTALQSNMTALTADLNGFKTTVSETYTSKTELNNLQIGGRNLLLNTAGNNSFEHWYTYKASNLVVVKDSERRSGNALKFTSTGGGLFQRKGDKADGSGGTYVAGTTVTISGYIKSNKAKAGFTVSCEHGGDGTTKAVSTPLENTWYYFSFTTTPSKNWVTMTFYGWNGVDYYLGDLKLELGDKATDWTPAPEDVDEKFTDYSTTTQMNSAISQSASSILASVSSTYATKASLELKVDKDKLISEINASADVITLKSNRFVLDSTNAKIAADGRVEFTGGTIGGWKIDKHSLYSDYDKYRVYIQTVTGAEDWAFSVQEKKEDGKYYGNFIVDARGYVRINDGYLSTKNHSVGGKGIEINESTIKLYSWTDKDNLVGSIYSTYIDSGNSGSQNKRQSLVICSDFNDELHLDYMDENRKPYVAVAIDRNADNKVHMMVPTVFHNELQTYSDDYSLTVNSNFSVGKKGTEKIARFWCYNGGSDTKSVRIFNSGGESGKYLTNCELSLWGTGAVQYNWSVNGTIYGNISSDSDRNIKKDIKALDIENSAQFIYSLIPSEFRFKNGTSNRLHHGLIAQEVKESMKGDWGVFIDKAVDDKNYNAIAVDDLTGEQTQLLTARYGLRYDELIADLIATVQSLNNRLKALEK
jgi:phage minor structural protein